MGCRSCGGKNLESILDLGKHAWCNNFVTKSQIGKEQLYPLHMVYCHDCELAQLDYTVEKETMFSDHSYVSGTTKTLKGHFLEVAKENKEQFALDEDDMIIDIGGNDGTQLLQYMEVGCGNVLNIESAPKIAKLSKGAGVPTVPRFFNEECIDLLGLEGKAKLINASGVFFHLEELHSVIKGIKRALKEDGVFIVQFMYLGDMIKKLSFDGIYHEHLCYYSLQSLDNLLEPYGLDIFDAYHSDIHGGSVIAKVCHATPRRGARPHTDRCKKLRKEDSEYVNYESLKSFAEKVALWKSVFSAKINDIMEEGKKIYGFGAPAKGNTLLTYCDIDNNILECIFEVNSMKFDRYTPYTHIPIVKEDHSIVEDDSYALLLSWNFSEEIISKCGDLVDRGVEFINPFN
jgi:SAM-dependent methyltransferase|tara:strand:+ start:1727 stop:2932 length:1206 start_codon:yes stop_codon:yes gene_type:complete